jgi:5-methylcytosine-specific restriction endonuclease McrA
MSTVAELIAHAAAEEQMRAARTKRLRERKAKDFYSSFAWRKVRYQFLRQQPRPLRCSACNRSAADGITLCVDHVKSVKLYPQLRLDIANLQVLCRACNTGKGSEFTDDWRQGSREAASEPGKEPRGND